MTGGYWSLGLTGEVPINHWMGAVLEYRYVSTFLKHFYIDATRDLSEPTSGVGFSWHSFSVGLNLHPAVKL